MPKKTHTDRQIARLLKFSAQGSMRQALALHARETLERSNDPDLLRVEIESVIEQARGILGAIEMDRRSDQLPYVIPQGGEQ